MRATGAIWAARATPALRWLAGWLAGWQATTDERRLFAERKKTLGRNLNIKAVRPVGRPGAHLQAIKLERRRRPPPPGQLVPGDVLLGGLARIGRRARQVALARGAAAAAAASSLSLLRFLPLFKLLDSNNNNNHDDNCSLKSI